jgi:putative drug exporter of the RND superfamily
MTPGRLARAYSWTVVGLRHVIVLAWIAGAVAATMYLPGLGGAAGSPLADLVPKDAEATKVAERSTELFGFPLSTDTAVVQHDPEGLPLAEQRGTLRAAREVSERPPRDLALIKGAIPITNVFGFLSEEGERSTTAVSYLYFSSEAGLEEREEDAHKYAQRYLSRPESEVVGVTGAAPARIAQFEEIENSLPLIELASVLLIALIVGLHFRSVFAPLVTLLAAAIAYLIAVRVLAWGGEQVDLSVAKEVQPLLLVLLLGLVTDYSVFFMSGMRRALEDGHGRVAAARRAAAQTVPIVFAAGLIVAAGIAALVVGRLEFFRAFGPSLALTTLVGLAVSITLLPAALALFGERLFGRKARARAHKARERREREDREPALVPYDVGGAEGERRGRSSARTLALARPITALLRIPQLAREGRTSRWRVLVARVMSAPPIALLTVAFAVLLLLLPATGLSELRLGVSHVSALPSDSEPKRAATAAAEGFAPGILSPTEVLLEAPGLSDQREQLARLEQRLADQPGVSAVLGPREQPPSPIPQVAVSRNGSAARYAVIFDVDPLGAKGIDRLRSIEQRMPALLKEAGLNPQTRVSYGGETALAEETVDLMVDDLGRIGLVALAVNFLLLALFMRAFVAPLYLLAASVLGLAATLGLTVFFAREVLGVDELTYYVPFAASVLLVSLGSDYNVFVAGRIWSESRRRRLREAIAVATPAAARAIRVAGIALAASFALLAIVPLRSFREFAFVMSAGILIDTFVVRPFLIPGLISLFGELSWRPGGRIDTLSRKEFIERVASRSGLAPEQAARAVEAVFATLAERITRKERRVLALHLPRRLRPPLKAGRWRPERFPLDEFVDRVARRQGTSPESAREATRAVMSTLAEVVARGEIDYLRAQLSPDYSAVLPDDEVEARPRAVREAAARAAQPLGTAT